MSQLGIIIVVLILVALLLYFAGFILGTVPHMFKKMFELADMSEKDASSFMDKICEDPDAIEDYNGTLLNIVRTVQRKSKEDEAANYRKLFTLGRGPENCPQVAGNNGNTIEPGDSAEPDTEEPDTEEPDTEEPDTGTGTGTGTPYTGWELLHRDVATDLFGHEIEDSVDNIEDFMVKYSRLGSLKDGTLSDNLYKTDGLYYFRMIPYTKGDRVSGARVRGIDWTQTSNPTLNSDVADFDNLELSDARLLSTGIHSFEGLSLSEPVWDQWKQIWDEEDAWINGDNRRAYFSVGAKSNRIISDSPFIPFSYLHHKYGWVTSTELYIWRGPKS
jgi:hypothetical protein